MRLLKSELEESDGCNRPKQHKGLCMRNIIAETKKNTKMIHRAYDAGVRTAGELAKYMRGDR